MKLIDKDKTYNDLIDEIDFLRTQDYDLYCELGDRIQYIIEQQECIIVNFEDKWTMDYREWITENKLFYCGGREVKCLQKI